MDPIHDRIVCGGRQHDDNGQPVGDPCGRAYRHRCDPAELIERARAGGWRIGPARDDGTRDAMCPSCGKPDPQLARLAGDLRVTTVTTSDGRTNG